MKEKIFDRTHSIFRYIIITLISISILSLTKYDERSLGYDTIQIIYWISLIFVIIVFIFSSNLRAYKPIIISFLILLIIQIISMYTNNQFSEDRFFRISLFTTLIISMAITKWNKKALMIFSIMLSLLVIFLSIVWFQDGAPKLSYQSIFRNPNQLNILLFLIGYFFILSVRYFNIYSKAFFLLTIICALALINASGARSIYLIGLTVIISYIILKFLPKFYKYLFPLIILMNSYLFYIAVTKTPNPIIDKLSSLTSQTFFNGREKIWSAIYNEAVQNSFMLGHGYGVSASDVSSTHYSTHNVYLQIVIESGLIGLAVFLVTLFYIWRLLLNSLNSFAGRLSSTFFLAILVYINFEQILFPNTLVTIAVFMWLTITFGINFNEKSKNSEA